MKINVLAIVDSLPKISPFTTQLLKALAKPNCSVGELAEIVQKDAALSARVLRTANSATFGRLLPVASVRQAISIQGVGLLRKFVIGSSLSGLFARAKSSRLLSVLRFNLHSVATATFMDLLTEEVAVESSNHAFVAGMLHDVGELLIGLNVPREHEQILGLRAVTGEAQTVCERKILGIDHAELSALAIRRWQLDEAVAIAVATHHVSEWRGTTES